MTINRKPAKRLKRHLLLIALMLICLCITTGALTIHQIHKADNTFKTGYISINLNDGKAVIAENEAIFEPGMNVERQFFIENQSSWSVYYTIYLTEIQGELKDVLDIAIQCSRTGEILYSGALSELTRQNMALVDELSVNERKEFIIRFTYPEDAGNYSQNRRLSFKLAAEAVQTKNNPDKEFD